MCKLLAHDFKKLIKNISKPLKKKPKISRSSRGFPEQEKSKKSKSPKIAKVTQI